MALRGEYSIEAGQGFAGSIARKGEAEILIDAAHDPRIVNTIRVIDMVCKVDTPFGPCWHRYTRDGYGEHADGSPFDGTGIGRAWPLLAVICRAPEFPTGAIWPWSTPFTDSSAVVPSTGCPPGVSTQCRYGAWPSEQGAMESRPFPFQVMTCEADAPASRRDANAPTISRAKMATLFTLFPPYQSK